MARRWGVLALVAISCHNRPTPAPAPGWVSAIGQAARPTTPLTSARTEVALAPTTEEADGHIEIKLGTTPPMLAPVPATDLSASETSTLLASLPALPPVTAGPALRPPSAAPPKGGTAATPLVLASPRGAQIPDVPATQPPAAPIAPMDPPEIQPTGEVDSDAEVTVRFAQSMLAVGAIDTRAAPPISIAPAVAGTWRWVDTRVAKFVPKASFAPATKYTVSVPAGIKAASGAALTAVTTATFSTPTLGLDSHYHQTLGPASPTVIWFDQPVDAANIGAFVRVEHRNTKAAVPFDVIAIDVAKQRWATEPRTDPAWLRRFEASDKLIIIAPRTTWPSGAGLRVVLAKGAPSAAGPLTTTTEQSFELDVAPTFTLTGISCGTPDTMPDDGTAKLTGQVCPAGGLIDVEFSNEILATGYRPEQIQIADTPRYENKAGYRYVQLLVPGDVGKKLTVKVARDLVDEYGQTLTGPNEATFTTKKPTPDVVFEAHGGLVVLDPGLDIPMWSVKAQSIAKMRVELYAVQPADYFEYERFETGKRRTPPGKRVFDKSYDVGRTNAARVRVDLRPALAKSGTGHVIAVATPTGYGKLESWQRQIPAWIQVTHLGLSARFDDEKIFPYVNRLALGKYNEPVAGVATSLLVDGEGETQAAAPTTAEGLAAIELPAPRKRKRSPHALVIARAGDDVAFSAIDAFERSVRTNKARWYVTDDRFTYKPGETVYIKGWVRWTHNGTNPGLALPRQGDTVAYTLTDPRDVKLAHGTAVLGAQGGFDFEVKLPKNANLGQSRFELTTGGESMSHYIAIEEFRTPAFEVTLNDDVGFGGRVPVIVGEAIEMTASARYYGGGGLGGARVRWAAMLRAASYRPPGWSDFSFGDHSRSYRPRAAATSNASLSSASTSTASIAISELPERRPSLLTVDASVTDVDRITLRDVSREILVHPSAFYVGVRHRSATELNRIAQAEILGS